MPWVACSTIPPLCTVSGKLSFKTSLHLFSTWQRHDRTTGCHHISVGQSICSLSSTEKNYAQGKLLTELSCSAGLCTVPAPLCTHDSWLSGPGRQADKSPGPGCVFLSREQHFLHRCILTIASSFMSTA